MSYEEDILQILAGSPNMTEIGGSIDILESFITPSTSADLETIFSNYTYEECYEDEAFTIFQYTTDDLLLAGSMASTIFNVLVMFCAIKLFRKSGDTMHLFILNMTVGDCILTVFCHPNELLIRKHPFLIKQDLCTVLHYFNWVGLAISGLSLTMLNLDKLIYFRWPLSYDRSMSKKRAALICVLIWIVSVCFISYGWFFDIVKVHLSDCSLQGKMYKWYSQINREQMKIFYELFMLMFCVLPVTSSLIVSIYLFNEVRLLKDQISVKALSRAGFFMEKLTRQKRNATFVGGASDQTKFRSKMKSLVFIFATTAWTSFSLLPYRVLNLARLHLFKWGELSCQDRQTMTWVAWVLVYLLTINPIVNPLITSLIYAPYRMTIKKFLVNIPGNRPPLYQYRQAGDTDSVGSLRRARARRASGAEHELAALRAHRASLSISASANECIPSSSQLLSIYPALPPSPLTKVCVHQEDELKSTTNPSSSTDYAKNEALAQWA